MTVSEIRRSSIDETAAGSSVTDRAEIVIVSCDDCGSPVESAQRYCVVCGAHRRDVRDPAARYLSHASARARATARAGARQSARGVRRRTVGLGTALLIALIPVAGVAGYAIGDSGTGAPAAATGAHHSTGTSGTTGNGSKAKSKLSNATGSKYVTQQNNSPNSVSIP